jgi:WD40 repeat protein
VRALHIEPDKFTLYSAAEDKKVKVWDLKSEECATLFGARLRVAARERRAVLGAALSHHAHALAWHVSCLG